MFGQQRLFRTAGGWTIVGVGKDYDEPSFALAHAAARVMLHPLSSLEITDEPIAETWNKFFPSFPPRQSYETLHPGHDEFFRAYEEPIDQFFRGAVALTGPLETVAGFKAQKDPDSDWRFRFVSAIQQLDALASAVRLHHPLTGDDALVEQWIAPTLLSALAMMALRDLAGGRAVLKCENPTCQKLYTSPSYQARYCSTKCRLTVNKRTYRETLRRKQTTTNR